MWIVQIGTTSLRTACAEGAVSTVEISSSFSNISLVILPEFTFEVPLMEYFPVCLQLHRDSSCIVGPTWATDAVSTRVKFPLIIARSRQQQGHWSANCVQFPKADTPAPMMLSPISDSIYKHDMLSTEKLNELCQIYFNETKSTIEIDFSRKE